MCQTSVCFLVFSTIFYLTNAEIDYCPTPNNQQGECKMISLCPALFSIFQKRPIRPKDADLLKRSECGFEGTLPKVCCPQQAFAATIPPSQQPAIPPSSSSLLPSNDVCGIDNQDRIYGGEKAGLEEFPWMALIEYEKDNGIHVYACGGVLISKRYVLTAAHCTKGKDLPRKRKLVGVHLGEHNIDTEIDCEDIGGNKVCAPAPVNVPVEEIIAHEQYDPFDINRYHDIALLRLSRDVIFTPYVKPICLPKSSFDMSQEFTGKKLTVAGWGRTEKGSASHIKLKLNVPVKSNDECTRIYRHANINLQGNQLCAGGETGKDSCRGDSGGPLMSFNADEEGEINWYAIGLVSYGLSSCGEENWPTLYTKVSNYIQWIVSKLRP